jgi:hypothetical protein
MSNDDHVHGIDTNLVIACALPFPARAIHPIALSHLHMVFPGIQRGEADSAHTTESSTQRASYEANLILSTCPQEQAIFSLSADAILILLV